MKIMCQYMIFNYQQPIHTWITQDDQIILFRHLETTSHLLVMLKTMDSTFLSQEMWKIMYLYMFCSSSRWTALPSTKKYHVWHEVFTRFLNVILWHCDHPSFLCFFLICQKQPYKDQIIFYCYQILIANFWPNTDDLWHFWCSFDIFLQ